MAKKVERTEPWSTTELAAHFKVHRTRIPQLAENRMVEPVGVVGRQRESLWPPNAHITLKPKKPGRPKEGKA
jgi:hypothetical protein